MKYTISKKYKIEYAHRIEHQEKTIYNRETKCRHLHGHSGVVEIFISSTELNASKMVIDFSNLKLIKDFIMTFDHSMIVSIYDKAYNGDYNCFHANVGRNEGICALNGWPIKYTTQTPTVRGFELLDKSIYYNEKERIWFFEEQHITSEVIAYYMYWYINKTLGIIETNLDTSNDLHLEELHFSETDNNKVIVKED
jgi:6-pyruvoyl-tetrahydropterin synthase